MTATSPIATELEAGWAALRRGRWDDARAAFSAVLERADVAEAHEGLGYAAWWTNDVEALFAARDRAYQLYRVAGDRLAAAGVAIWIASDHLDFRDDDAVANGWLRRARRLLDGLDPAPQHGWLAANEAFNAILVENDVVTGRQLGATATELGRSLGSIDLEAVGMATEGLALVTQGRVAEGMPLLDEATAIALSGEFEHLWAAPWICCFLIYACERVHDLERAEQWCRTVADFSARTGIEFSWGLCRAHHAGVLVWQGAWEEAERELGDAAMSLERSRRRWGTEATVRLAELRRRQGRASEAEALFRLAEAHPLALVGLGELCLDRADWQGACDLGERLLRRTRPESRTERLSGLQLLVRATTRTGDRDRCRRALAELEALASLVPTSLVRATASFCSGVAERGEGDLESARRRFEDAVDLYARAGVPYEEARARLELAAVHASQNRPGPAREQAERARDTFLRLGATREADRAATYLRSVTDDTARGHGRSALTAREREVLALVAQGMTDAEIAGSLALSRHTAHRHVANILNKLGCSSRAAAVATAASQGLLRVSTE